MTDAHSVIQPYGGATVCVSAVSSELRRGARHVTLTSSWRLKERRICSAEACIRPSSQVANRETEVIDLSPLLERDLSAF